MQTSRGQLFRIDAAAVIDGLGTAHAPGSVVVQIGPAEQWRGFAVASLQLVAVGPTAELSRSSAFETATVIDRPAHVLIPGLVNAHAHLDLTHIGPRQYDPANGFRGFVDIVRAERRTDEAGIHESVLDGAEYSLRGGVVAVGDIAGAVQGRPSAHAYRALRRTPMWGVSFIEFFAVGNGEAPALANLGSLVDELARVGSGSESDHLSWSISPHATNTVSLGAYARAAALASGRVIATHAAETAVEREFIASGTGPHRAFLEQLGLWNEQAASEVGHGRSPIEHLGNVLDAARVLAVHVNQASDADIARLARPGAGVAYCPRSSEYFHAQAVFGPHRYRAMVASGVVLGLGTDSIINLPAIASGRERISTLDEARVLHRRDRVDEGLLLRAMTVDAATAIGLPREPFSFQPGRLAGLVAVPIDGGASGRDPLALWRACLDADHPPELLYIGK